MGSYILAKRMIKSQKEALFQELPDKIIDYLRSADGQLSISTAGQLFGLGIKKGIGLGGLKRGGKTFGIPNEILMPIVEKFVGKIGDKAITKENKDTSSDPFAQP